MVWLPKTDNMFDCGDLCNWYARLAVSYLPIKIFENIKDKLVLISTAQRDGCRIARQYCKNREIILLSERVFPKQRADEASSETRYFIYVVLHEIAHAFKKHKSPKFDNLTSEENNAQEQEADDLAFEWFNNHVKDCNNPHLKAITQEEIKTAQEKSLTIMKRNLEGGP